MKKAVTILFIFSMLISCRDKVDAPEFGFDYFGFEEGNFVTYEVTEVFHDSALIPEKDTFQFILKTIIGEPIIDNQGRTANKVFRYSYDFNTGELIDQRVWTGIIADSRGELIEENQRKIRMVFAITPEKTWNVNAFNTMEEESAIYKDLHTSKTINEFAFDSTVTVEYEDFFSLVDFRKKFDVYAKGVGLVLRNYKDFTISNFDTLDVQIGTETQYRLIDYGKE